MYIGIVILIKFASSTRIPAISVERFSNGAQFLHASCVVAASGCFIWTGLSSAAAIAHLTGIVPVTKMYASK